MPRRSHESLGDYISSACFGGVAFLSLLNGLEAFYAGNIIRAIVIWFVCFLFTSMQILLKKTIYRRNLLMLNALIFYKFIMEMI